MRRLHPSAFAAFAVTRRWPSVPSGTREGWMMDATAELGRASRAAIQAAENIEWRRARTQLWQV